MVKQNIDTSDLFTPSFCPQPYLVHAICELRGQDKRQPAYWQPQAKLQHTLGKRYHRIETAVIEAMSDVPRASSLVETNKNKSVSKQAGTGW